MEWFRVIGLFAYSQAVCLNHRLTRSHWNQPCDPSTSQVKIYVTGSKQTEAKTCASLRSYRTVYAGAV